MGDKKMMTCCRCWGSKHEPGDDTKQCSRCEAKGIEEDLQLSTNFWLSEFLCSDTAVRQGIPNEPSVLQVANLMELASKLLQPIRDGVGSISISSGFRGHVLNGAVGGSDNGVHPDGYAADCSPMKKNMTRKKLVDWIIASGLAFDQVIFEGTWVHIGFKSQAGKQRKMALMAFPTYDPVQKTTKMKFFPYDPKDPRISAA